MALLPQSEAAHPVLAASLQTRILTEASVRRWGSLIASFSLAVGAAEHRLGAGLAPARILEDSTMATYGKVRELLLSQSAPEP